MPEANPYEAFVKPQADDNPYTKFLQPQETGPQQVNLSAFVPGSAGIPTAPSPAIATAAGEFAGTVGSDAAQAIEGAARSTARQVANSDLLTEQGARLAQLQKAKQDALDMMAKRGVKYPDDDSIISGLDNEIADAQTQISSGQSPDVTKNLANTPSGQQFHKQVAAGLTDVANFAQDTSETAKEMYGQIPGDASIPAQVGRGAGHVAAMVPSMAAGPAGIALSTLQAGSQSYAEAYDQKTQELRNQGVTDEHQIEDEAAKAGSTEAIKTIPQFGAYMVGGKLTSMAVAKLFKSASPLVQGIAGGTAAIATNAGVSAVNRGLNGEPMTPTVESTVMDAAFGAHHGLTTGLEAIHEAAKDTLKQEAVAQTVEKSAQVADNLEAANSPLSAEAQRQVTPTIIEKTHDKIDEVSDEAKQEDLGKLQEAVDLHEEQINLPKEKYEGPFQEKVRLGQPLTGEEADTLRNASGAILPKGYEPDPETGGYVHKLAEGEKTSDESFAPPEPEKVPQEPVAPEKPAEPAEPVAAPETIVQPENAQEVPTEEAKQPESNPEPVEPPAASESASPEGEVAKYEAKPTEVANESATPAPEPEAPSQTPEAVREPAVGQRVRLGKQLTPFEIVTEHPQTEADKANGEQYYDLKNTKTGEIQHNVLSTDFIPIKPKAPKKTTKNEKSKPVNEGVQQPASNRRTNKDNAANGSTANGEGMGGNLPSKGADERAGKDEVKSGGADNIPEPEAAQGNGRSVRTEELRKQGEEALGEHHDTVDYERLAALEESGIKITFDQSKRSGNYHYPDGSITLNLRPSNFRGERPNPAKYRKIAEEETIHSAQLIEWRRQWIDAGKPGLFNSFVTNKARALHEDLIERYNSAPAKDKPALERALVGAYNIYYRDFNEITPAITSINELISKINDADEAKSKGDKSDDLPTSAGYIMELTRMLYQQRESGLLSERTFNGIIDKIREWVSKAFAHFKEGIIAFGENGALSKTQVAEFLRDFKKVYDGQKPSAKFIAPTEESSIGKMDKFFAKEEKGDEGAEILSDFALTKDQQKLMEDNLGIADRIAAHYRNIPKVDFEDLRNEGLLAMAKAAKNYDPSMGNFENMAGAYVSRRLKTLYRNQLRRSVKDGGSINEPISEGKQKVDVIPAPAEKPQGDTYAIGKIQKAVQGLPERERRILEMKAEGMSLREISEGLKPDYNLSHERVNQIYKQTASELQKQLSSQGITSREDVFPEQSERTQYLPEKVQPEDETRMVEQVVESKLAGEQDTTQEEMPEEESVAAVKQEEEGTYSKSDDDFMKRTESLEKTPLLNRLKTEAADETKDTYSKLGKFAKEAVQSIPERFKAAVASAKDNPKLTNFRKVLLDWNSRTQTSALRTQRLQERIGKIAPSDRDQVAITNWLQAKGDKAKLEEWKNGSKKPNLAQGYEDAMKLPPEKLQLAKDIEKLLDDRYQEGVDKGIFKSTAGKKENYVTQIWRTVDPDVTGTGMYGKLAKNFKFAKESHFKNYYEGEQAGFDPASKRIGDLLGVYLNEFDKTLNTRQFAKDLTKTKNEEGEPLATVLGGMKSGGSTSEPSYIRPLTSKEDVNYRSVGHNALQKFKWIGKEGDRNVMLEGELGLHPDIYNHVKNVLGRSQIDEWYEQPSSFAGTAIRKAAKGLDRGSRVLVNTLLGGLSTFHPVHLIKRSIAWRVSPFSAIKDKIDPSDPTYQDATRHGLALSGDNRAMDRFSEGLGGGKTLFSAVPGVGKVVGLYQHWLFHEFIPSLKLKNYNEVLPRNLARYAPEIKSGKITPEDVKLITAEQVNYHYGHLNYALIGRNPTMQHFLRAATLAPDFLEATSKNFALDLKGTYSKAGREATIGLLVTAAFMAAVTKTINALVDPNGDPHFERPFSVVHNGRIYSLRNEVSDLERLVTTPWQYSAGRVSPLVGSLIEAVTGRNYRGEKISGTGQLVYDIATKGIPISLRAIPGVSRIADPEKTTSAWENFLTANGVVVSRNSPINQVYPLVNKFNESRGKPADTGTYPSSPYLPIRYALEDGDLEKAADEIVRLADKKQTADKIYSGFKESVSKPFTGNKADDAKLEKSLKGADLAIYQNGVAQKARVLQEFQKVWTGVRAKAEEKIRKRTEIK